MEGVVEFIWFYHTFQGVLWQSLSHCQVLSFLFEPCLKSSDPRLVAVLSHGRLQEAIHGVRLSTDAYALAKDDPKTPQEKRQVGQRALLANNEREHLDICDASKRNDADASTTCIDTHPTPYQGKRPSQPVRRKPAVLGKTTPTSPINENDARKTVTETARKMPMVWTALPGGGTDRNRSYHPKK